MISLSFRAALLACTLSLAPGSLLADSYLLRAEVRDYITQLSEEAGLDRHRISGLFARLSPQQGILDAISTPAERTLTWKEYRPIFITRKRIDLGRAFIEDNRAVLERAEAVYGVPVSVIAAIIGVETFYGRITGKHPVLESLATLAFDYPPRASFFKRELSEFIVLSEAEGWQTAEVKGSYAGAMGVPQFISSSYRQYAVDFDGDGQRDLFGSMPDIVGSVANYLSVHGWVRDAPVAERWRFDGGIPAEVSALQRKTLRPTIGARTVAELGFESDQLLAGTQGRRLLSVMNLHAADGEQIWIGYPNFYVITRYNHSRLYALAVTQLAAAFDRSS